MYIEVADRRLAGRHLVLQEKYKPIEMVNLFVEEKDPIRKTF